MTTFYERLGVTPSAAPPELRAAYRSRARQLHPDRNGAGSARAMAELNEAWRVLSDPAARLDYDRRMGLGPAAHGNAAPPPRVAPMPRPVVLDDDLWDPEGLDPRGRLLRWLLVVVVVLAALILLALFAYAFVASPEVVGAAAVAAPTRGCAQRVASSRRTSPTAAGRPAGSSVWASRLNVRQPTST